MAKTPTTVSPWVKAGFAAMTLLFVFAAAVQYNDPDPWSWIALYLAAAGVTLTAVWRPGQWIPAAAVAVVSIVWALALAPAAARTSFPDLFQSWQMMSTEMEEGRELGGLILAAVWTGALALRAKRR